MAIQRYSTPTIRIRVDPSVVQDIWLTISESDRDELITKTMDDMTAEYDGFTLTLTSEDTAKLPKGRYDTCEFRYHSERRRRGSEGGTHGMTEIPVDRMPERIDVDVRDKIIIRAGTAGSDYEGLKNKPQINSVELTGNRSLESLGIEKITNSEILNLLEGGEE